MLVSKFGIRSVFFFIFFLVIGRLYLFPFGDEPDFEARAYELVRESRQPFWTPYFYFDSILRTFTYYSSCYTNSTLFSYFSSIDDKTCTEDVMQSLGRIAITIFSMLPFLFAVIFRETTFKIVNGLGMKFSIEEWNYRLDVLCLVLVFLGFVFHVGVLGLEQFVLVLTIPIFLFWGRWPIIVAMIILISFLDLGNSTVIATFVSITCAFSYLDKRKIIIAGIALVFGALILGISSLSYISNIGFLSDKANAMLQGEEKLGLRNKYPIFLRPIITFMTGIFLTPSGVKVIPVYILYGIVIVRLFIQKKTSSIQDKHSYQKFVFISGVISATLFFIFMVPNYSNAKYYIFMLPFIFYSILNKTNKKSIFNFIIVMNFIIYLHLFFYKL
ncbi:hypothetical protein LF887_18625 [Chryseobacterium sp. MEBOG06]|uniref:hypothetical protein n=1 Tax=unclassified Chryseobacterium TaxID=2593645 RepID=UPI001F4613A7|nr:MULTISPECIES: hypothetical protein [unclassified Chryseobacterium]UKB83007.1 hypothetical protein LF887_18625 [Chryseobacterium sp. MEBOG06]